MRRNSFQERASHLNQMDYEYKGLMAEAWDVLRGDTSGWADRPFYREIIRQFGGPALDVGCGTGRLLLDYMAQGIDIDGMDNSPDMLEICRHKAEVMGLSPTLYEQYVETLDLPRKYRTVLIPSSSIQLILEPESAVQALRRIFDHLLPGGAVAASIMTFCKAGDPVESEHEGSAVRAEDGVTFRRVSRSRFDHEAELEHTEDLYQKIAGGEVVAEERHRRSPATRSYTQAAARALFERAGFGEVRLYSGFTFEDATPDDTLFCVVGRKPRASEEPH